jgi:RNA polymerase sigma-70 factor (ECF subfamily)
LMASRGRRLTLERKFRSRPSDSAPPEGDGSVDLDLLTALTRLPANQRRVFILRAVLDLSTEEAASEMNIPEATARSLLHRARVALAADLGLEQPSDVEARRSRGSKSRPAVNTS